VARAGESIAVPEASEPAEVGVARLDEVLASRAAPVTLDSSGIVSFAPGDCGAAAS
jgi:hypothetical protein